MGLWIELRCDDGAARDCWSNVNNGPMGHAMRGRVPEVVAALMAEGKAQGWTVVRNAAQRRTGLRCPACTKHAKSAPAKP